MSASLIVPFELEYMKWLQLMGWNSAAVITSVNSSILTGLISTISGLVSQSSPDGSQSLTEALIADVEVPQVNAQVVGRNVGLAVRVH